jgi:hypothetical protein
VKRLWRAATKDYGVQVPSGWSVRGWTFWAIGFVLVLIGIGSLISGQAVLGGALVVGGALLVLQTFVGRSPFEP